MRVRGKGGKERLVPVGQKALAALAAYRARLNQLCPPQPRDASAVYLNQRGSRLTTRSVARIVDRYVLASGIASKASPHVPKTAAFGLRCSATACAASNAPSGSSISIYRCIWKLAGA